MTQNAPCIPSSTYYLLATHLRPPPAQTAPNWHMCTCTTPPAHAKHTHTCVPARPFGREVWERSAFVEQMLSLPTRSQISEEHADTLPQTSVLQNACLIMLKPSRESSLNFEFQNTKTKGSKNALNCSVNGFCRCNLV